MLIIYRLSSELESFFYVRFNIFISWILMPTELLRLLFDHNLSFELHNYGLWLSNDSNWTFLQDWCRIHSRPEFQSQNLISQGRSSRTSSNRCVWNLKTSKLLRLVLMGSRNLNVSFKPFKHCSLFRCIMVLLSSKNRVSIA